MRYFFILGNNPTLSTAEISAVFPSASSLQKGGQAGQIVGSNVFILETDEQIDAEILIKKLGGTIKIGKIIDNLPAQAGVKIQDINKAIFKIIDKKEKTGKFKFGFSYYGDKKLNLKTLGMETKKHLKEKNISCRWVTSKEKTLSSVVVEQNKLTSSGIEITIFPLTKGEHKGVLIGQTLAVQPFKELSFRDYGRPARDDKSGMLPPKLAQIMINLSKPHPNPPLIFTPPGNAGRGGKDSEAGQGGVLLDPFCGSGTILTEAMIMGYKNITGSDNSKKAIEDTRKNVNWIIRNWKLARPASQGEAGEIRNLELHQLDAENLTQKLKTNSIDMIVTEPYLGPQRGQLNLEKTIPELEKLYSDSLKEFKKILKPEGRIVMIWPVFIKQGTKNKEHVNPNLHGFKIINPIPKALQNNKNIKLTNRNTIIYGREGQKVWREIVILEK